VTLPNFVVAGAPRCGTTSLHYYLRQHPQVCMSTIKEPNFFLFDEGGEPFVAEEPIIRKSVRRQADYEALFRPAPATVAVGDVSPLYLHTPESPGRIRDVCGEDTRIIALLRRPAARAWSHFLHAMSDVPAERRDEAFAELVDAEMAGTAGDGPYRTRTHLVRLGRYDEQLARYEDVFGADRLLVLLMEDLDADTPGTLRTICSFLGVDPAADLGAQQRYNTTGAGTPTGWSAAKKVLRKVQPALKAALPPRVVAKLAEVRASRLDAGAGDAPPIDPATTRRIADWCAADVEALGRRIGRDLSDWTVDPAA
jgi:hypothetical protein